MEISKGFIISTSLLYPTKLENRNNLARAGHMKLKVFLKGPKSTVLYPTRPNRNEIQMKQNEVQIQVSVHMYVEVMYIHLYII